MSEKYIWGTLKSKLNIHNNSIYTTIKFCLYQVYIQRKQTEKNREKWSETARGGWWVMVTGWSQVRVSSHDSELDTPHCEGLAAQTDEHTTLTLSPLSWEKGFCAGSWSIPPPILKPRIKLSPWCSFWISIRSCLTKLKKITRILGKKRGGLNRLCGVYENINQLWVCFLFFFWHIMTLKWNSRYVGLSVYVCNILTMKQIKSECILKIRHSLTVALNAPSFESTLTQRLVAQPCSWCRGPATVSLTRHMDGNDCETRHHKHDLLMVVAKKKTKNKTLTVLWLTQWSQHTRRNFS